MRTRWTSPEYGKAEVDKAGKTLTQLSVSTSQLEQALTVMSNWRSSHSFPMNTFKIRLGRASKKIDTQAVVVQRLKRVPSIVRKLNRTQTQTMKLSQMQDIGGCRAVLSDVSLVRKLSDIYTDKRKSRGLKHKKVNEKDYIKNPKPDGYRSIHLIYKYKSDKKSTYDGLLVEIQIRSRIQHAWATAVETVDLFTKQAIKSNEGRPEWIEFFKLVSSAFAVMEGEAPVPNTPTDPDVLRQEIKKRAVELRVFQKMEKWTKAITIIEPKMKELHFFLLVLDVSEQDKEKLEIRGYLKDAERTATDQYLEAEKSQGRNPDKDVVLVAADSIDELKKAYPNYFIDTSHFLEYLKNYLES